MSMSKDDLTERIETLKGDLPQPRLNLTNAEIKELVLRIGLASARDILKAKRQLPQARIPFLFSSLDTQAVVDLLANDVDEIVRRLAREKAK
jgi:hypothetical protein